MVYKPQFHVQPPKHGKPVQFLWYGHSSFQDFYMIWVFPISELHLYKKNWNQMSSQSLWTTDSFISNVLRSDN